MPEWNGREDMKRKLLPAFLPALLSLTLCATMIPVAPFARQAHAADSSEAEALYQTEADGGWQVGTFDQALLGVYDGGTVKLLQDVARTECANLTRSMTITSNDPNAPRKIIAAADQHGHLLSVNVDASTQRVASGVVLENIIIDGGSQNGLTATRAAIAVSNGQLTLGTGAVVQNNTNEPQAGDSQSGIGGGIYVDKGTLLINGGLVTGNTAAHAYKGGGGVFVATGTCILQSGAIRSNKAAIGGGVYADNNSSAGSHAVLKLSGGSIVGNAAGNKSGNYGGGVYCASGSEVRLSGSPILVDNTSYEEACGGIYLNGDGSKADVIIEGALTEQARVSFFSWLQENNYVVAAPENGYTIASADMVQLHYAGQKFGLKLNDAGNVVLYEADFVVEAKAYGGGSITPSGKMGVLRGDSVKFTITPDEGSVVKDVTVNGQSVIDAVTDSEQGGVAVKTYVLKNIDGGAEVKAFFEEVPSGGGGEGGEGGSGDEGEAPDDPVTPPDASSDSDQQTPSASNKDAASEGNAKSAAKTGDTSGVTVAAATAIVAIAAVAAGAALLALKRSRKRHDA